MISLRLSYFLLALFISFLFILNLAISPGSTFGMRGNIIDYATGGQVNSGNVIAFIKETGENYSTTIGNGVFDISFTTLAVNASNNRFTVGILFNTSDERIGYSKFTIGTQNFASLTQKCTNKLYHFRGLAIDPDSGGVIPSGNVTIGVRDVAGSNSTVFSNGIWEVYYNVCLLSGNVYTFQITLRAGDKRNDLFVNQVAK